MLYRTHHPLLITINPIPHSSLLSPHILVSSPSLSLQKMECVQGASRPGSAPEKAASVEDLWGVNGVSGDDFFVDELLDFSNGFSETEEQSPERLEPEVNEQEKKKTCSVLEAQGSSALSVKEDFVSLPESEITVPSLESLEWLSHFVEDSFSDYSLTGKLPPNPSENRPESAAKVPEPSCFTTPVQTKARTKRARTGVRVWPVLSSSFTDSATSSSSSTSSTTTGESFLGKPKAKKFQKKTADASGGGTAAAAQPRRCSHCGVTKTPQWRAGPLGSKTLCNACGVRYKSGRLLPEYRPACSPTFSNDLHSNNHRKVLEMRRKKELEMETAGSEFSKSC